MYIYIDTLMVLIFPSQFENTFKMLIICNWTLKTLGSKPKQLPEFRPGTDKQRHEKSGPTRSLFSMMFVLDEGVNCSCRCIFPGIRCDSDIDGLQE